MLTVVAIHKGDVDLFAQKVKKWRNNKGWIDE